MTDDDDIRATLKELVRRMTALEALMLKLTPGRPWTWDDAKGEWVPAEAKAEK